jgi:hypothetical protein
MGPAEAHILANHAAYKDDNSNHLQDVLPPLLRAPTSTL